MSKFPWQIALSEAVTDPKELFESLQLDPAFLPAAQAAAQLFPLRIPRNFVARMEKGNLHDPLLQQVLPLGVELTATPGFSSDPLSEKQANPVPGLLHKYHGRVLLTLTGVCAVNCRYCFRREFPYAENNPGSAGWEKVLTYIANDKSIKEVILSGGDPLIMTDQQLNKLIVKITEIPHVKILRIHSRLPIVLPERITDELMAILTSIRLKVVIVIHGNHPNELDDTVAVAVKKLRNKNITVLNQSVLLKNINDSVSTLIKLSEKLFSLGVLPYYLHLLDKVSGTAHFDVNETIAKNLHQQMMQKLPGYLVPKLVRETSGAMFKLPVY